MTGCSPCGHPSITPPFVPRMLSPGDHGRSESVLLGSVAVCFLLLLLADVVGASMELGCFLAGVAISSQGITVVEQVCVCVCAQLAEQVLSGSLCVQVRQLVEPLRDFFTVFFFASIGNQSSCSPSPLDDGPLPPAGFHVFPTFLLSEFSTIFLVTFCVVVLKVCVCPCLSTV